MEAATIDAGGAAAESRPDAAAAPPTPAFFKELAAVVNAGTARGVVLAGEVHDLFHLKEPPPGSTGRGGRR